MSQLSAFILAAGLMVAGITFLLGSTQWFTQGVRHHQKKISHVDGVWYNNWKEAMQFISNHVNSSDVIVTPWPLLANYYGPSRKIYLLNNNNSPENFKQFMVGPWVIRDLETLQNVIQNESSGWIVSERRRFYHVPISMPPEIRRWIEKTLIPVPLSSAEDMVLWRWDRTS